MKKPRRQTTPTEYIQRVYNHSTPLPNGCVIWTAYTEKNDRPVMNYHGKRTRVARVVWQCTFTTLTRHEQVLTTCGNPLCVNKDHLNVRVLCGRS